jgi:SH3-like domain-containing protein
MKKQFIATSDFEIHYPHPLIVRKGDQVKIGRKDSTWPEWWWVTNAEGISGWIHQSFLKMDAEIAIVTSDYTAAELSLKKGDLLESDRELGGWHWCRKNDGAEGWVPEYPLRLLPKKTDTATS